MSLNVLSHEIKISTISHTHFVLFQFKDLPRLLENNGQNKFHQNEPKIAREQFSFFHRKPTQKLIDSSVLYLKITIPIEKSCIRS